MRGDITLQDIQHVLRITGINGFDGRFDELGGGEVNDTYKLDCGDRQIILRVARDRGQKTLVYEARALRLLDSPHIPKLIFFDKDNLLKNRLWILEGCIPGNNSQRLTLEQFRSLGNLLAQVHKADDSKSRVGLREQFLEAASHFGDERFLLNHPDGRLRVLIGLAFKEFAQRQAAFDSITPVLIHRDATPSNILADGDSVGLIDWEFSTFSDPMCDFSTVYYEDIEYNMGKWRIKIEPDEKDALFDGYKSGGGTIDEERIRFWIRMDKLGAAVFLYWRLNQSTRKRTPAQTEQFELDFNNLVSSLSN